MTGCHDDASGLADRSRSGEGASGRTTGRRSGGGRHGAARPKSVRAFDSASQEDIKRQILHISNWTEVNTVTAVYGHAVDSHGML